MLISQAFHRLGWRQTRARWENKLFSSKVRQYLEDGKRCTYKVTIND